MRAMINETVQLGVEVTPGTPVATTKRFVSTNMMLEDPSEFSDVVVPGKYQGRANLNKEWTEWAMDGALNFNEMAYHLSSLVGVAGLTPGAGADVGAHTWVFTPTPYAPETIATYTLAVGPVGITDGGERSAYNHMIGLEIPFSRDGITISGRYRGRELLFPHTVESGGVTEIEDDRALPGQLDIFLDDAAGDVGDSKVLTSYEGAWRLNDRRGIAWPINSALTSWGKAPEIRPTAEFACTVEDDALARDLHVRARTQQISYIRFVATGPVIVEGGTLPYTFQIDMACTVRARGNPANVQELRAREFTFGFVNDATLGAPFVITLINSLAAL